MSDPSGSPTSVDLSAALRIDAACRRFEAALQAGESPRIEDYLADVGEGDQRALLRELGQIETHYRRAAGESLGDAPSLPQSGTPGQRRGEAVDLPPGYEFLGVLGRGGMGVVYKARQVALNRVVAVKMILAGSHANEEEVARFRREAEAVARLRHPNVVQIFEIGDHDGRPYLALEYLEAGSLADRLAGTPLPAAAAARLVGALAEGVAHAHERGVVHRDLKPGNVLLSEPGALATGAATPPVANAPGSDCVPKVTDFGLAKSLTSDDARTATGAILGTPSYMAPEQARGKSKDAGPACDIYALGAILYECLTGRPPFKAESPLETLVQVQVAEPVPPRRLNPTVPIDLETIGLKCLRKEPAKRYGSAQELADDLRRFTNREPIQARQTGPWERGWLWCRRNPWVAGLLTLVGLLLVTVAGVAGVGYAQTAEALGKEAKARETAEEEREKARESEQKALAEAARNRRLLYDADMQLASQFWRDWHDTATTVSSLLDAQVPRTPEEEDLRDFTWQLQRALLRKNVLPTNAKDVAVLAAMTPSGEVVTLDGKGTSFRFDPGTRRRLRSKSFPPVANLAMVSLTWDGRTGAIGTRDGDVHLYDLEAGRELRVMKVGVRVYDVKFSRDGKLLAVTTTDKQTRIWDIATDRLLHTFPMRSVDHAQMTLSDDGTTIYLANHPSAHVSSYSVREGYVQRTRNISTRVNAIACSPDGKLVAAGDHFGGIWLWDAKTHQEVGSIWGHHGGLRRLAFSPDSKSLVVGMDNGVVTSCSVEARERRQTFKGHTGMVVGVAISHDGKSLVTTSADGETRHWDLTVASEARPLGKTGSYLAYSRDGKWLATTLIGGYSTVYDANTGTPVAKVGARKRFTCSAFAPDGRLLATAGTEGLVYLWDVGSWANAGTIEVSPSGLQGLARSICTLAFSPDGKYLVIGSGYPLTGAASGWFKVWNMSARQEVHSVTGLKRSVHAAAFSPSGELLAVANDPGKVAVWEVGTWRERGPLAHPSCMAVAFAPDGKTLTTGGEDSLVRLWDLDTGHERKVIRAHTDAVWAVTYSPDGKTLVTGGRDRNLRFWDAYSLRETRVQPGNQHWVTSLVFSPDGKTLGNGLGNSTVWLWETEADPPAK